MNNADDFVYEWGKDFTLSLKDWKEIFFQQNSSGIGIPGILAIIVGVLIFMFVGSLLIRLFRYIFGRKKRILAESRFSVVKKTVLKVKFDSLNQQQLQQVVEKGLELYKRVDKYTGRNYGTDLPSLVHRISMQLGLGDKNCAIFFIASFFYDCGFLEIPQELFFGEILSRKEKVLLKKHVLKFQDQIPDLPKEFYDQVYNACSYHHENFDGSGYPEGLSGEQIPTVAKIIRVVESYMSLISRQSYHKGLSKKKALKTLRSMNQFYDQSIVDILETLV